MELLKPYILNIDIKMCMFFFFVFFFFLMALELILTQLWPLEQQVFLAFFLHCRVYQFLLQFSMNVF